MHEGARVAAFVHEVVDQPRVAAHRDALAGGGEVGLVGDRVLPVGEVVGGVGQQLDQRDAEIGRRALGPARHQQAQAVEHQAAEALVVLGQVVDVGPAPTSGGQSSGWAQSKSAGHSTLKENSMDDSRGSKSAGGSSVPELATMLSV